MTRYGAILADPAWDFDDHGTRVSPRKSGHYETMSLARVCAMGVALPGADIGVRDLAARDSWLFLWIPGSLLIEGVAVQVCTAWGFTPKQVLPWVKTDQSGHKVAMGMGHYFRLAAEYLVLGRRGKAKRKTAKERDVIFAPRGAHSAKPDESYRKIERFAKGPYLELFARRRYSEAWDVWGNEAPTEGAIAL